MPDRAQTGFLGCAGSRERSPRWDGENARSARFDRSCFGRESPESSTGPGAAGPSRCSPDARQSVVLDRRVEPDRLLGDIQIYCIDQAGLTASMRSFTREKRKAYLSIQSGLTTMHELDAHNVLDYLHATGRLAPDVNAAVVPLAWGVSNIVLRITPTSGPDMVVKQARERLRTRADWFSRLERIWTEASLMRMLGPLLPEGTVPAVLFEDRPNYVFGMEAVDPRHTVWKADLLAGRVDASMAPRLAQIPRGHSLRDVRERIIPAGIRRPRRVRPAAHRSVLSVHARRPSGFGCTDQRPDRRDDAHDRLRGSRRLQSEKHSDPQRPINAG